MIPWRLIIAGSLAALLVVAGSDWALSKARLDDVVIESWLDPPRVVADGKNATVITLRVTEHGQPRAGDLVQLWIDTGSSLVIPDWVITDAEGMAQTVYTPNPASVYDPHDEAKIYAMDINVGRLVEVGKRHLVVVPLATPES